MLVLALESATDLAGVALADPKGVLASVSSCRGRRHAESIAPAIDYACRSAEVSLGDVDAVCVDVGPGLFTGLRVGIATAKGLAFGLGIPVVCVTSLEVLARGVAEAGAEDHRIIVPVVDARRGEVFSRKFASRQLSSGGCEIVPVSDELLSVPEELARSLQDSAEPFLMVGDGARRYASVFAGLRGAAFAPRWSAPPVEVLAAMGVERLEQGLAVEIDQVSPRYLRDADVRINWERRLVPGATSGGAR